MNSIFSLSAPNLAIGNQRPNWTLTPSDANDCWFDSHDQLDWLNISATD